MRYLLILIIIFMIGIPIHCKKKTENRVPLDQFNIDNSNNYRFIFKETIRKENWREKRYKKDEFKE